MWTTIFTDSVLKVILYGPGFRINQSYPGNSGSYDPYISPILEILDRTIHISVLSWKYWIVRSIFAHMLSYIWIVRSIFAPMLMSRGVAGGRRGPRGVAGRRRRRRRPNNSPIWPEPWTIRPRDQISRSGPIPHFD